MQRVNSLNKRLTSSGAYLFQVIAAMGIGAVLGLTAVVVSDEGSRTVIAILGALLGGGIVLYTGHIRNVLILAIMIDSASMFDVNVPCERVVRLMVCGWNFSLTFFCIIILYADWLLKARHNHTLNLSSIVNRDIIGKITLAWLLAVVLSFLAAREMRFSFYHLWMQATVVATYFYLAHNLRTRTDIYLVLFGLALGLALQVGIMQLQSFGVLTDARGSTGFSRISGTLHSANVAGSYLAQTILLFIPLLFMRFKTQPVVVLLVIVLALAVNNLIGTESRGAWSAVALGSIIIVMVGIWRRWINFSMFLKGLLVVVIIAAAFSGNIIERLTADDNGSADARAPLAEIAFNMIRANPVVGVGVNQFGGVLNYYIGLRQYGAWLNIVHNGWLLVWSETGTIGFVIFVAFRLAILWQCWRIIRFSTERFYSLIGLGIAASTIGASLHMMGEIYGGRFYYTIFWLQAAIITAVAHLAIPVEKPVPVSAERVPSLPPYRVRVPSPSGD